MRIILFTGKGGVGKSTIAAATAVRTARQGRRTLLVSSDLAHNLSDIFEVPVGDSCAPVTENLRALEVDILNEIREHWSPIQEYVADITAYLGMDNAVAEEVALIPGMDAVFVLARILREIESGRFETVVVDCAPTAGALRLLTFTDSAAGTMNKLLDIERKVMKLIRPITNRLKDIRVWLPEDKVYETFGIVIENIGRLGDLLKDPEKSSVRLVLTPDKIAIAETRRAYTYFGLFGFPVDSIFVNKIFPDELVSGYLKPWCKLQKEQMDVISSSFLDTKIFPIKHLKNEPTGIEQLDALGKEIYGEIIPDRMLSQTRTVRFAEQDGKISLAFTIANLDKSSLDVGRKGNELIINTGSYSRVFALPDTLVKSEIEGASYKEGKLIITFARST